eukprot:TRINITY_DN13660_c0_g1_i1.p1 TRINITY_DN13660_c0_g1~~TRINITY_DN13660_c0_g1_i1.p1  ORF type:complete len:693 (+),score=153.42 TRINITY_DN13660_c0_g1_i1:124-2079(+)
MRCSPAVPAGVALFFVVTAAELTPFQAQAQRYMQGDVQQLPFQARNDGPDYLPMQPQGAAEGAGEGGAGETAEGNPTAAGGGGAGAGSSPQGAGAPPAAGAAPQPASGAAPATNSTPAGSGTAPQTPAAPAGGPAPQPASPPAAHLGLPTQVRNDGTDYSAMQPQQQQQQQQQSGGGAQPQGAPKPQQGAAAPQAPAPQPHQQAPAPAPQPQGAAPAPPQGTAPAPAQQHQQQPLLRAFKLSASFPLLNKGDAPDTSAMQPMGFGSAGGGAAAGGDAAGAAAAGAAAGAGAGAQAGAGGAGGGAGPGGGASPAAGPVAPSGGGSASAPAGGAAPASGGAPAPAQQPPSQPASPAAPPAGNQQGGSPPPAGRAVLRSDDRGAHSGSREPQNVPRLGQLRSRSLTIHQSRATKAAAALDTSGADWERVPASAFTQMLEDDVKRLSSCGRLSAAQLSNIPEPLFDVIPARCLHDVTPQGFSGLRAAQLRNVQQYAAGAVTAQQMAAMIPAECASWAAEDNFKHLPVTVCGGVSAQCVQLMRGKDRRALLQTQACEAEMPPATRLAAVAAERASVAGAGVMAETVTRQQGSQASRAAAGAPSGVSSTLLAVGAMVAAAAAGWGWGRFSGSAPGSRPDVRHSPYHPRPSLSGYESF